MGTLKARSVAAAIVALAAMPFAAQAGLTGDSVTVEITAPASLFGQQPVVVGTGPEFIFDQLSFDFGDLSFSLDVSGIGYAGIGTDPTSIVSLILDDLDFGGTLTGVVFSGILTGVTVVFDDNTVTFSWLEQGVPNGNAISARFLLDGATVPEPATALLLGAGLLGYGLLRRRLR